MLCNHAPVMHEGIEHSNVHSLTCLLCLSPGFCGRRDAVYTAKESFVVDFLRIFSVL